MRMNLWCSRDSRSGHRYRHFFNVAVRILTFCLVICTVFVSGQLPSHDKEATDVQHFQPPHTTTVKTTTNNGADVEEEFPEILAGTQQIRKDLNELPEMKKAKELRAESERKQIEIESMRELAKLEEELKRKVADEQDGEDKGGEEPEHNPEKQQSAEEGQQQHHEHLKDDENSAINMANMNATTTEAKTSTTTMMNGEGNEQKEMHTTSEMEHPVTHQMETLATTKAETIAPITVASTMSQTTASTGQTAKSIEGQAEEESSGSDDPFQTTSPRTATSTMGMIERQEEPESGQGSDDDTASNPHAFVLDHHQQQQQPEMEHEELAIAHHDDGHVHQSNQQEMEAKNAKEETITTTTTDAGLHHESQQPFITAQQNESDPIEEDMTQQGSTTMRAAAISSHTPMTTTMPMAQTTHILPEEGDNEHPQHEQGDEPEEGHFMAATTAVVPHHLQQQPLLTTEESAVIAGDKSVFDSKEEGASMAATMSPPEEAKEEHLPKIQHSVIPMLMNEGSDGFERVTKMEGAEEIIATTIGNNERHETTEAVVTNLGPETAKTTISPEWRSMVEEEDEHVDKEQHGHGQMPPAAMITTLMATKNIQNGQEEITKAGILTTQIAITPENAHSDEHEHPQHPSIDKRPEHHDENVEEAADTPAQRGDLPGVETMTSPMVMSTTTTATEHAITTAMETHEHDGEMEQQHEHGDASSNDIVLPQQTIAPSTTLSPAQLEMARSHAIHTQFSLRFPDIEWRPDFEDLQSGGAKKLRDQIDSDLRIVLSAALEPANSLVDYRINALRKGSVILMGELLTKHEVDDPLGAVTALEQAILAKGGKLGDNAVDTDHLSVGGLMPGGGAANENNNMVTAATIDQQKQQQQDGAANTGFIIGGAVIVGVLIVVFAIFAIVVFGIKNHRRNTCGSLKLGGANCNNGGREEICMVENGGKLGGAARRLFNENEHRSIGSGSGSDNNGGVNLMSLKNTSGAVILDNINRPVQQQPINGGGASRIHSNGRNGSNNMDRPPILLSGGSQFSTEGYGNGHGSNRS